MHWLAAMRIVDVRCSSARRLRALRAIALATRVATLGRTWQVSARFAPAATCSKRWRFRAQLFAQLRTIHGDQQVGSYANGHYFAHASDAIYLTTGERITIRDFAFGN